MLRTLAVASVLFAALVGAPASDAMITATPNGSTLTLTGDGAADHISLNVNAQGEIIVSRETGTGLQGCDEAGLADWNYIRCPVATTVNVDTGGGDDQIWGTGLSGPVALTVDGGPGNDTLRGSPGDDTLDGGPGDDSIYSRDGAHDTIDCGDGGGDHLHDDVGVDTSAGCEAEDPQVQGTVAVTGAPDGTLTASGPSAIGRGPITESWTWTRCTKYVCQPALAGTGPTFRNTHDTSGYGTLAVAYVATNAGGSDRVVGEINPWEYPFAPDVLSTVGTTQPGTPLGGTTTGGTAAAPFAARDAAASALRTSAITKVATLSSGPLRAYRRAGTLRLTTAARAVAALTCSAGPCTVALTWRMTPRHGRAGRAHALTATLATAQATVLSVRLTRAELTRLRRAHDGHLILRGTLHTGAAGATAARLAGSLPVR